MKLSSWVWFSFYLWKVYINETNVNIQNDHQMILSFNGEWIKCRRKNGMPIHPLAIKIQESELSHLCLHPISFTLIFLITFLNSLDYNFLCIQFYPNKKNITMIKVKLRCACNYLFMVSRLHNKSSLYNAPQKCMLWCTLMH